MKTQIIIKEDLTYSGEYCGVEPISSNMKLVWSNFENCLAAL
jgi:hypothetical protein